MRSYAKIDLWLSAFMASVVAVDLIRGVDVPCWCFCAVSFSAGVLLAFALSELRDDARRRVGLLHD